MPALLRAGAVAYVLAGLWLMVAASPRVPYADPWRFLVGYLDTPFPASAFAADNGHREVLPNLVRIAELHWFGYDQTLQIGLAALLALLVLGLCWRTLQPAPAAVRPAALLLVSIGMFWFGNERKLAHGNEALPLFLVQTLLACGLGALLARRRTAPAAWFAGGCGIAATMTFGAGAACFAAFVAVGWLTRAPRRQWLPLLVSAALAAALLLLGNAGAEPASGFAPLDRLDQLLRWLGAPFVWLLHPLLASDHAARLPTDLLSAPALLVAQPVEAAFGPSLSARWPAAAFGLLALLRLAWSTWRCRRDRDLAPPRTFALGLAWFGLGVGGLVVAARFQYFQQHPDQLTTARYLPWSMLLWTGLGLDFVLQPGRRPRPANVLALACLVAFVPSSWWTGRAAWKRWRTAELTALGAAVGALGRDFPLVETRAADLLAAVPRLQAQGAVMFAWPETKVLGERLPPARWRQLDGVDGLVVTATTNLFAGPCAAATFELPGAPIGRLLLVDADDLVVGLALHCGPGHSCAGWLRREVAAAALRVGVLR